MIDFIKTYAPIIIAAIALMQPWIIALWKRYLGQGSLEIYETGNLEIGYGALGTSIGLNGTLRCISRDLFVQTIQLELVKLKDSSKHILEWGVFREGMQIIGENQGKFELPYSFMLSTSSPRRFNIQFHDMQVQSEIGRITNKVSEEWNKVIVELGREELLQLLSQNASQNVSLPSEFQDPFFKLSEVFQQKDVYVNANGSLYQMCYWEAGEYTLKVMIQTSNPNKSFEKIWKFTLTEQDVEAIRLNVIQILRGSCRLPLGQHFFAYPKYELK